MHKAVVFETKGIPVLPAVIAIALPAGLGTAAPVAGTAANGSTEIALTGITHAQSAVTEYFNLNGGVGANIANLLPTQFPAQNHTGKAPGSAHAHTGKAVDGHLSRTMDRHRGRNLPAQPDNAQILHDKGIHTALGGMADQRDHIIGFLVGDQGV